MNLEQTEKQLAKIATDRSTNLEKFRDKLAGAQRDEKAAAIKKQAASDNDSPAEYARAAADHRAALDVITMYEGKIRALEDGPAIDKGTFNKHQENIITALDQSAEAVSKRLTALATEARELLASLTDDQNKGNSLLYRLQMDLMRAPKGTIIFEYHAAGLQTVLNKFIYEAEREGLIN